MTKYLLSCLLIFSLTSGQVTGQTKDSIIFQITPNPFDSSVTFSFDIPNGDTIHVSILDRWATEVATIIPLKYFDAGRHDTTCNLSILPPKTYLARLGVGRTTEYYRHNKSQPIRIDMTSRSALFTRRSTSKDKR